MPYKRLIRPLCVTETVTRRIAPRPSILPAFVFFIFRSLILAGQNISTAGTKAFVFTSLEGSSTFHSISAAGTRGQLPPRPSYLRPTPSSVVKEQRGPDEGVDLNAPERPTSSPFRSLLIRSPSRTARLPAPLQRGTKRLLDQIVLLFAFFRGFTCFLGDC